MTPMHFIDFFVAQGIVFSGDKHKNQQTMNTRIARYIRKYSEFFADLSLQNYEFNNYDSVTLACACIAAARKTVGIDPMWREELTQLS